MTNDDDIDIKLETGDDVKDEKIKEGIKTLAKKHFKENSPEYEADSLK